ncbi:MAG: efflux RND transporter permease subunit, partial [Boseongicola sp.]|nr:efflux RND transporter permease subunit [Boseongicola sp.]
LVVMAIIPFGLVGAVWGHYLWNVPLSMFSVVGLIGMIGIIINDSIVLVTTVDEYADERGIVAAIVDGASDRLRPVFLTTATTVLGLAPLLYETSKDAQFLKPTVITLAYGLGFGLVLVLLIVPALLAVGHDIGRHVRALRYGWTTPGIGPAMAMGAAAILAWFAVTVGSFLVAGSLPFGLEDVDSLEQALLVYVAGSAAICFVVGILAALLMPRA